MFYLNEDKSKLIGIYFNGWVIFCLVEITFRFIKYVTFPWYKVPLTLSIYLLLLFIYGIIGIIAGLIINYIFQKLSKWSSLKMVKTKYFNMVTCQTILVLLYGGNYLYERNAHHNSLYISCYLVICVSIFLILYTCLKKKETTDTLLSTFISLSFIVDILLMGGVYINRKLIESEMFNLSFSLPINICALLVACFLVYLSFNTLLPRLGKRLLREATIFKRREVFFFLCLMIGLILLFSLLKYSHVKDITQSADRGEKPNVILITMDTTRCDHLSCYGYKEKTTPNLDQLTKDSVVFENVHSTSSWTIPAHASIFTGLYPSKHGAHTKKGRTGHLSEENVTLAEILTQQGYKAAGFIGGYFCSSYFGLSQGFDYYDENLINLVIEFNNFLVLKIYCALFPIIDVFEKHGLAGKRVATQINRVAFKWLNKNYQYPFFLFLNYFDPHHPYHPLDDSHIRIPNELAIKKGNYVNWEGRLINKVLRKKHTLTAKERKCLLNRYDNEIRQMDRGLGEFLKFLKEIEVYDNSLIVVTSDHGESFGEHGLMLHTPAVYEELVRVPLIVKYPKDHHKTGHVSTPISLVDIMPEVLIVVGIPIPTGVQGVSFSQKQHNLIVERYKDENWAWTAYPFGERSLRVIYEKDYKYIWTSNGKHELYNLRDDPQELNNLFDRVPEIAFEMEKKLDQWVQTSYRDHSKDRSFKISKEVEETLKAMGYLHE